MSTHSLNLSAPDRRICPGLVTVSANPRQAVHLRPSLVASGRPARPKALVVGLVIRYARGGLGGQVPWIQSGMDWIIASALVSKLA